MFRQFARRSNDSRFPDVQALIADAQHEKNLSREREYRLGDLTVQPVSDSGQPLQDLQVVSSLGSARFTHWSFGQLCSMVGAPARYLRDNLSPALAAKCLNEGIQGQKDTTAKILVRAANGQPTPLIRAFNSPIYSRVWEADLYRAVSDRLGADWVMPVTRQGKNPQTHRNDRSSSLLLVHSANAIIDPTAPSGDQGMYRAIRIRNSEVGASAVIIEELYFRLVCSNGLVMVQIIGKGYRRRHVASRRTTAAAVTHRQSAAPLLDEIVREVSHRAARWAGRSAEQDQRIVTGLINTRIGDTDDEAVAVLRSLGATEDQAKSALRTTRATENVDPLSYWGIAQGLTRDSQTENHEDERFDLDRLAGLVMARGAKLVAA